MYAAFHVSFFSTFSSDKAAYTFFNHSKMATLAPTFTFPHHPSLFLAPRHSNLSFPPSNFPIQNPSPLKRLHIQPSVRAQAAPTDLGVVQRVVQLVLTSPPTWQSAVASNLIIFVLGSPLLVSGLSLSGSASAFLLATLTWRAFWIPGFLLAAIYFILGTAVTKVKLAQKEAQGIAEKRSGRRGPGSVIGSSSSACVCALLSIKGIGGAAFSRLWELGFVACFCTKLSDTVSSEIGKAYGKTTYLVTTLKVVPRGTEGAVSVEGTLAGLFASILLASTACIMGQINIPEVAICVLASQIANVGESLIGAALQEKQGFQWLNNDAVNVINIFMGTILAILMRQIVFLFKTTVKPF
ncbi:protein VTE6, chloroplastic-like [Ipomoea triloba]|uniref:protein VTE6, chloroplastic-like n=1 Tax=Ipomoea triloba TaxID=35885 RepID=UPI00125E04DD|nr:protein VTE6, chloroplastic-like [Ipomoea triloba]